MKEELEKRKENLTFESLKKHPRYIEIEQTMKGKCL